MPESESFICLQARSVPALFLIERKGLQESSGRPSLPEENPQARKLPRFQLARTRFPKNGPQGDRVPCVYSPALFWSACQSGWRTKKNFACCGISPKFILPERSTAQRRNPHGPSLRRRIPFSGTAPPRQKNSASFVHGNPRRLFRAEIVPGERRNKSFVRREKMTLRAG